MDAALSGRLISRQTSAIDLPEWRISATVSDLNSLVNLRLERLSIQANSSGASIPRFQVSVEVGHDHPHLPRRFTIRASSQPAPVRPSRHRTPATARSLRLTIARVAIACGDSSPDSPASASSKCIYASRTSPSEYLADPGLPSGPTAPEISAARKLCSSSRETIGGRTSTPEATPTTQFPAPARTPRL
jgi:hypothetical protein